MSNGRTLTAAQAKALAAVRAAAASGISTMICGRGRLVALRSLESFGMVRPSEETIGGSPRIWTEIA
jgi:hypothetical protein